MVGSWLALGWLSIGSPCGNGLLYGYASVGVVVALVVGCVGNGGLS